MFTVSFMYWMNIAFAIFSGFMGNFIQATVFLVGASVFFAAELIVKEIRRMQ